MTGDAPSAATRISAVIVLGLLVRLPFLATDFHTSNDLDSLRRWARVIHERGLTEVYAASDANYPPLLLYAFGISAAFESRLPGAWREGDRGLTALIKLWPMLADVAIAALLAAVLRDARPTYRAWAAAAFLLHPAVWYISAHWGQCESVYTFFLLASVIALDGGRLRLAWLGFSLGVMTKLQAVALLPLLLVASVRRGGAKAVASGVLTAVLTGALLFAPWLVSGKADDLLGNWPLRPPGVPRVDVSAYNLWYLMFFGRVHALGSATGPLGGPVSYRVIGAILFAALAALVAGLVWRRRDLSLPLPAAILALGFFLLPTEVHERLMFPALPFLLLAITQSPARDTMPLERAWLLLSLTFLFNLVTTASPVPHLWTNLVAASDTSTLVWVLKVLALVAAAVNLSVFVRLVALLAKR